MNPQNTRKALTNRSKAQDISGQARNGSTLYQAQIRRPQASCINIRTHRTQRNVGNVTKGPISKTQGEHATYKRTWQLTTRINPAASKGTTKGNSTNSKILFGTKTKHICIVNIPVGTAPRESRRVCTHEAETPRDPYCIENVHKEQR